MAHIRYRVTGAARGKAVSRRFPDTRDGRREAQRFAATLDEPKTAYDVRARLGNRDVSRTFTRRKDADAYLTAIEHDKLRGIAIDPRDSRITVEKYFQEWLAGRVNLAPGTVDTYRYTMGRFIAPTFGTATLAEVSPQAVTSWHARISRDHHAAAAKAYRLLAAMMRTAVAEERIGRNPCQTRGAGSERSSERPVATVAEVEALADEMPPQLRLAVLLAAWCQLRRGELLGLRRKDIDLLHATVTVSMTRMQTTSGKMVEKPPKTEAGHRVVSIPPHIVDDIRYHLDSYVCPRHDSYVLVGERGAPLRPHVLQKAWDRARGSLGLDDLRLHDLRHSGLTWSAATGATLAELMHRAGHSSPAAAVRYQHATKDRDRTLAEALTQLSPKAKVVSLARDTRGMKARGRRQAK